MACVVGPCCEYDGLHTRLSDHFLRREGTTKDLELTKYHRWPSKPVFLLNNERQYQFILYVS